MSKKKIHKIKEAGKETLVFFCEGCNDNHSVIIKGSNCPIWAWNGSEKTPTFSPSVRVRYGSNPQSKMCHFYVRKGIIEYLHDCTHKFKDSNIPLKEFDLWD